MDETKKSRQDIDRERYLRDLEKRRQKAREYYYANRDKCKARYQANIQKQKQYYADNRDKLLAYQKEYQARKKNSMAPAEAPETN